MTDQGSQESLSIRGGPDVRPSSRPSNLHHGSSYYKPSHGEEHRQSQRTAGPYTPKSLREEISRIREQVIMHRLDLRERRVDMRQQHRSVRNLEARILRHWQTDVDSVNQDVIRHLHDELCTALEQLGPMEEDYDEKEDGLDTLEFDLEVKEKRFYRHHSRSGSEASSEFPSTRRTSMSDLSEVMGRHPEHHQDFQSPQYQYYSRVGDAKIVRERLIELEAQKIQCLDIEREREALSIPLYQENIDFLSNYDSEYAEHLHELEKIENDIHSLGIQAGLLGVKDTIDTAPTHAVGEVLRTYSAIRRRSPATEPGKPMRFHPTIEEPPRRRSEGDVWDIPNDPRSTRERISQWILERLQNSKLEKARHRAILNDPKLGEDIWWNLVLEFWQMDRAARSSNNSSRHVSGVSSAKPKGLRDSLGIAPDDASNVAATFPHTEELPSQREQGTISAHAPWRDDDKGRGRNDSDSLSVGLSHDLDEALEERPMSYVRALYDYHAGDGTSLSFRQGDIIEVIMRSESGWWDGVLHGVRGFFPSNYCAVVTATDNTRERTSDVSSVLSALPLTTFTWPREGLKDQQKESIDQLKYLDLAATPSAISKDARNI
ncbi:MAG: hypothetical protein Q9170_003726 [Blastenia crenularia]